MWHGGSERLMIPVNYGGHRSQCYVRLPSPLAGGPTLRFTDLMSPAQYDRDTGEIASRGLYLDMPPWGIHVFEIRSV
jgi:hypothetical protein